MKGTSTPWMKRVKREKKGRPGEQSLSSAFLQDDPKRSGQITTLEIDSHTDTYTDAEVLVPQHWDANLGLEG